VRRTRTLTADEVRLWRTAMKSVTPYKPQPPLEEPAPPPAPAATVEPEPAPLPLPLASPARKPNGVDGQTLKQLSRGERKVEAVIDLHGMTVQMAHSALRRFIEIQAAAGKRCILVITGKGGPDRPSRLKHEVPLWLEDWKPPVLAVTNAQPKHGGAGALYVLLQRRR
jgi:DNA-nicking Smr family endonuclease